MVAGELKRLAQREGKAEAVHQAEHEGDDPAPRNVATKRTKFLIDDVFQRHVDDRHRDQRFYERREPERIRDKAEGRGDQRNRMPDGESGYDDDEGPQPPERNYQ